MYNIRHVIGHYVQRDSPATVGEPQLFLSVFISISQLLCFLKGYVLCCARIKSSKKIFFSTARLRMLVFIDEHGFFYCPASNNTLC